MADAIDIAGQRFARLVVIGRAKRRRDKHRFALWDCKCDCGVVGMFSGKSLRTGMTRSCGCLRRETTSKLTPRMMLEKSREQVA